MDNEVFYKEMFIQSNVHRQFPARPPEDTLPCIFAFLSVFCCVCALLFC